MTKRRALIVDDERLSRQKLRRLLAAEADVEVVGECASGPDAVGAIRRERPDLVFLDIQMPGLNGFDVLREAGVENFGNVVFVTAHDEYAVRAFEIRALDYLLKPFDAPRFRQTLARVRLRAEESLRERIVQFLEQIETREPRLSRILVKSAGRLSFVRLDEIDWIEAADNYVRLHVGSDEHLIRETMTGLESRLDPVRFVRAHRSAILNVERVQEVRPIFHGDYEVLLRSGATIPVGRNYRDRLIKALAGG
jgi:two-component system LytT family response regulator